MNFTVSDGFPYYISLAETSHLSQLFSSDENFKLLSSLTEEQVNYRYAPSKWSIKQIVGHIIYHERIMTYLNLRFSRKDTTPLPGYDQYPSEENSRFDELPFKDLLDDLKNARQATINLLNSLSKEQLLLKGTAWDFELTVEEFLKATIGHEIHHMKVIKEKYLK